MITNIELSLEACKQLNISYEILHPEKNVFRIKLNNKLYYFANDTTPVNSQAISYLLKDKEYIYNLFKNKLRVPKTLSFLSPLVNKYTLKRYLEYPPISKMLDMVAQDFDMPVLVRKSTGRSKKNQFLCSNIAEVESAAKQIFDINNKNYDSVALVQEHIEFAHRYIAIGLYNELVLLYNLGVNKFGIIVDSKISCNSGESKDNVGKQVANPEILKAVYNFMQPIFQEIEEARYFDCEIGIDKDGRYWLTSMTAKPNYSIFTKNNDSQIVVDIFKKMIEGLSKYYS